MITLTLELENMIRTTVLPLLRREHMNGEISTYSDPEFGGEESCLVVFGSSLSDFDTSLHVGSILAEASPALAGLIVLRAADQQRAGSFIAGDWTEAAPSAGGRVGDGSVPRDAEPSQ
jgi:hypothetical protein